MTSNVYCKCGKLLQVKVSSEGVQMRCLDHGIVWRFFIQKPDKQSSPKHSK